MDISPNAALTSHGRNHPRQHDQHIRHAMPVALQKTQTISFKSAKGQLCGFLCIYLKNPKEFYGTLFLKRPKPPLNILSFLLSHLFTTSSQHFLPPMAWSTWHPSAAVDLRCFVPNPPSDWSIPTTLCQQWKEPQVELRMNWINICTVGKHVSADSR